MNPVAKYAYRFNKSYAVKTKKVYNRKDKYKPTY